MGRYYEITGLGTVTSVLEASSIQRCGVPDGTRPWRTSRARVPPLPCLCDPSIPISRQMECEISRFNVTTNL